MDKETYGVLAKVRIERAEELVEEAQELLKNERYKSANNIFLRNGKDDESLACDERN